VSGELQVLLPIEGLANLEALRSRLEKDIANPNFADKTQAELARKRLADMG
jgi:valyl-tRNA synthetase